MLAARMIMKGYVLLFKIFTGIMKLLQYWGLPELGSTSCSNSQLLFLDSALAVSDPASQTK